MPWASYADVGYPGRAGRGATSALHDARADIDQRVGVGVPGRSAFQSSAVGGKRRAVDRLIPGAGAGHELMNHPEPQGHPQVGL